MSILVKTTSGDFTYEGVTKYRETERFFEVIMGGEIVMIPVREILMVKIKNETV